ncbi:Glycosyltransferase involved in cell wall bisynthesis [Kyrpidia spormannii]|uniref:Glycosyltransferase involved in cell wall bisynthesis n=2 Tax=Kyrpidia spormannii TaxID=2055160 RepID=A0ACA8Z569_9BACL|nr:Glycosyltransferase involved in cell wall bisynthesis [Kyrpidia spormannii]CAB3390418.1 Glycosyltransferase involved in cell wall bisynthesis [Kyrpidia spormannii]
MDDASPDDTRVILERLTHIYGSDWLKIICHTQNRGAGAARNTGWDAATQPYIAFLDSDDSWNPRKIEIQLGYMLKHRDLDFSAHRYRIELGEGNGQIMVASKPSTRPICASLLLIRNFIATPTVMVRKDIQLRFPERRFSEDYLLWLEMSLGSFKGMFIEYELTSLHKAPYGSKGLSAELWQMELGELQTYFQLHREGYISGIILASLVPFSLIKYVRRVVRTVLVGRHCCEIIQEEK